MAAGDCIPLSLSPQICWVILLTGGEARTNEFQSSMTAIRYIITSSVFALASWCVCLCQKTRFRVKDIGLRNVPKQAHCPLATNSVDGSFLVTFNILVTNYSHFLYQLSQFVFFEILFPFSLLCLARFGVKLVLFTNFFLCWLALGKEEWRCICA